MGEPFTSKVTRNITAYLERLKVTFTGVQRVYLTGSSAGAFGAQINLTISRGFPNAEVHALSDSGQMIQPNGTLLATGQPRKTSYCHFMVH